METYKYLDNTNSFLLDISLPIINYLIMNNDSFEQDFRLVCYNNPRFVSKALAPYDLINKTEEFLTDLGSSAEYIGCSCHNKTCADFREEIIGPLKAYITFLCYLADQNNFNQKLNTSLPAFSQDYNFIKDNFFKNIDLLSTNGLEVAEKSLLYWQDAMPDVIVQEALVDLRYAYLAKLIKSIN